MHPTRFSLQKNIMHLPFLQTRIVLFSTPIILLVIQTYRNILEFLTEHEFELPRGKQNVHVCKAKKSCQGISMFELTKGWEEYLEKGWKE